MSKDLSTSAVARSNVLNNRYALGKLEEHLALGGLRIEGELVFFKAHLAELLDIDERTIDRYLAGHETELKQNGYQALKEKSFKNMNLASVDDLSVVDMTDANVADPLLGRLIANAGHAQLHRNCLTSQVSRQLCLSERHALVDNAHVV
jgi:hypothetical protein